MSDRIDHIATTYHGNVLPDMHIEEACQLYELNWILSFFPAKETRVLDLGFGDGVNFVALAKNCNMTMIEGSKILCERALKISKEKSLGVHVVHSMFEDFESSEKYDVILASHVLEHVDDPIGLLVFLQNFLKFNGKIVGIVPNAESFHRRLGVAMGLQSALDDLSARDLMVGHQRVYSLTSLNEDAKIAGMDIESHRGFFLKVLANSQMTHLELNVLKGLLRLSDDLPTEDCANIGFVLVPMAG